VLPYRKDGSTFWMAVFVSPWANGHGQVAHRFLSFLDISCRETETALRRLMPGWSVERRVDERTRPLTGANARLSG
jgi:hypothetical protein